MNLEKLNPWNWFKHEESESDSMRQIPLNQAPAATGMPLAAPASLLNLHQEMDRWFDNAFRSFGLPSMASSVNGRSMADMSAGNFYRPQIDVAGDDKSYQISLDVPGMTEADLSLEVRGDVLTIKGEKEERKEDKDKRFYHVERRYGAFQRRLTLPEDASVDDIKATLSQGVLKLEIPRSEVVDAQTRRISIDT